MTINNTKLKCRKVLYFLIIMVVFFKFGFSAYAASVSLSWDVNSDADYYVVYWGTSEGKYLANSRDIGKVTSYTATIPDDSDYYFAVKAFNSCGNSSDFSDWVLYEKVNNPPVANAGDPQTIAEGSLVTLDGSGSNDSDIGDTIKSYHWKQTEGVSVTLSDSNVVKPSFTAPDVGTTGVSLIFLLTVSDNDGSQASASCVVNVKDIVIPNNSPVAKTGAAQTIAEGSVVLLDGSGSYDSDTGDTIKSYHWTQTEGVSVTLSDPNVVKPSFTAPDVGTTGVSLIFLLTVSDNDGSQASASCVVNVKDIVISNNSPVANAGVAQTIVEGSLVTLDGAGSNDSDIGDTIKSYHWKQTEGVSVNLSDPHVVKPSFTAPDVGTTGASLTFLLKVADNDGLQASASCIVNVTDTEIPNNPPVANAGVAQTIVEGSLVTLDGAGSNDSDTGDTIKSYQWTQTEGVSVTLSDPNVVKPSFTAPDVGTTGAFLTFLLKVADNDGLQANASCIVNVTDKAIPVTPVDAPVSGELDVFEPVPLSSIITSADNYPSIEVLNKKFEHLEWLKTGWAEYNDLSGVAHVAMGDIDGSGKNEIIIGLARVESQDSIPGGLFQIIDENYSHLSWGRVQWSEYNIINGETWPVCGDIDGDGIDEIIIGLGIGGQGYFEIFKYKAGKLVHFAWGHVNWAEYNLVVGETRPVCADIDGDGADEIIVGLGNSGNSGIPGGKFEVFDNDLRPLFWGELDWLEYNQVNGETWPAPGDVDGDGNIEIVVGLGAGGKGKMAVFEVEKESLVQSEWAVTEWPEYNEVLGETRPVCVNIDEDPKDEIIVGLGRVHREDDIPGGFFLIMDDDFTLMEWGQINNSDFNTINGESAFGKGPINNSDKIIIGLGSWDIDEDTDNATIVEDINDNNIDIDDGTINSEGAGCFVYSSDFL